VRLVNRGVEVFAAGADHAQLIVRRRAGQTVTVAGNDTRIEYSPQSVMFNGLTRATTYPVLINGKRAASVRTLAVSGAVRAKIATISDLHIGEPGFAFFPRLLSSPDPTLAHPLQCLRAAVAEINAWQPDLVVAKGDLAHRPTNALYDLLAGALGELHAPLILLPGNHDGGNRQGVSIAEALAPHGLRVVADTASHELQGARIVALNTVHPGLGAGWLGPSRVRGVLDAAETRKPIVLFAHHQFMRHRIPRYWPPGVPVEEADRFLRALTAVNPNVFVSSGHTHRNRRYDRHAATLTEVGSTKDHPGVWARYELYDDALVQTVQRIAEPDVLTWTEGAARAVGTVWGRWSPGRLGDRCFVHRWPQPGRTAPM
jgi:3',5'-cyclic-AMP phosphodiesterase